MASNPAVVSPAPPQAPGLPAGRLRLPQGGLGQDLRAIKIVWYRDLIRFVRDRMRLVTALVQPVLYLLVLGTGLTALVNRGGNGLSASGIDVRTFMFPGVMTMAVVFTAMFSSGSIVWDREFGFLREMLVAPVSRASIVIGKLLGGATVATFQGVVILALAGLVGVPYRPSLLLLLVFELILLAGAMTAFGVMAAARIKNFQSFMALMQMVIMPMYFLSGAMFPLSGIPGWLRFLTRINPLTYAVDPLRRTVFAHLNVNPFVREALAPGLTWGGWRVPVGVELLLVAAIGLVLGGIAVVEFGRAE
jgi:ABC-2 type transport system permease protein